MSLPEDLEASPIVTEADQALKNFLGLIGVNADDSWSSCSRTISIPINVQTKDGPVTYFITTVPSEEDSITINNKEQEQQASNNSFCADDEGGTQSRNNVEEFRAMDSYPPADGSTDADAEEQLSAISCGDLQNSVLTMVPAHISPEEGNQPADTWAHGDHSDFYDTVDLQGITSDSVMFSNVNDTMLNASTEETTNENNTLYKSNAAPSLKRVVRMKANEGIKCKKREAALNEINPKQRSPNVKATKHRVPAKSDLKLDSSIEENSESEGALCPVTRKSQRKKRRKIADWLAEGIDPTKIEDNVDQVRMRFEKGCQCPGENCFEGLSPEFVYRHRLNIADLTRAEHDMYLMGVTMSSISNPEATVMHTKRQRLHTSYVYLGREVCMDAWLYLENCTNYQLKRIRKHLLTHGVSPRVHGNQGKKPHNTFPFQTYQHTFDYLDNWFKEYVDNVNKSNAAQGVEVSKPRHSKHTTAPIYLPQEQTRKKLHQEYKAYFEKQVASELEHDKDEDTDNHKIMGYSSFSKFLKVRFPHVKFAKMELNNAKTHLPSALLQDRSCSNTEDTVGSNINSTDLDESIEDTTDESTMLQLTEGQTCTIETSSSSTPGEEHFVISIPIDNNDDLDLESDSIVATNMIYLESSPEKSDFNSM